MNDPIDLHIFLFYLPLTIRIWAYLSEIFQYVQMNSDSCTIFFTLPSNLLKIDQFGQIILCNMKGLRSVLAIIKSGIINLKKER